MVGRSGIILGGGIAGLAFAAAAHRLGLQATVLEAGNELRTSGSGLVLGPTAMKSLAAIDLRDKVIGAGRILTDGCLADLSLRSISQDAFGYFSSRTGEPFVGIERSVLMRVLAEAAPVYRTGVRYQTATNQGEDVRIDLASGESVSAPWAVLADGIRSRGRSAIAPAEVRDAGQWCWRGIAQGVGSSDFDASFREGWGAKWRFGFVALGGDRTYWFVTQRGTKHALCRSADEQKASLLDAARQFHPIVGKLIAATPSRQMLENRLEELPALPRWHDGRIVCIGDAVHAMTPNLGLGATLALEDAVTLAAMLAQHGGDMTRTAPLFSVRRKARAERAVRESRLLGALAHVADWVAPLRTGIMRRIPRKIALSQLAWAYEYDDLPKAHNMRNPCEFPVTCIDAPSHVRVVTAQSETA